nr:hypothetical protein [Candidatus Mycoplasma haematolamae]
MNIWAKSAAGCAAFLCASGTAAKVTYDFTAPENTGSLVKLRLNSANGPEVEVWLPSELNYAIPEDSKLQMTLGESSDSERVGEKCINVIYKGNEKGGLIWLGNLEHKSNLSNMTICKGQATWTVVGKNNDIKKIRCPYGRVLGLGRDDKNGQFLTCTSKPYPYRKEEVELDGVKCTRQGYTNTFSCVSNKNFSLRYAPVNVKSGQHADPAIKVTINKPN